MRWVLKMLGRVVIVLGLAGGALWLFGPYEPAPLTPNVDTSRIGANLDNYFATVEGQYANITKGVEKQVIWAGDPGAKTDWSVVYIHGFLATLEEIRPVPDMVAKGLGANLIYTRLRGHGRDGDALAEATVQDWINDTAEALSAARAVSDMILVISTSTGGTLVTAALNNPAMAENVVGSIFVAPNYGLNNPAAPLLTTPAARYWLPHLVGETRVFEPENERHAKYWTTSYPSVAVLPMAALVKAVANLDHSEIQTPALFWYSNEDTVVDPAATLRVAGRWGGPAVIYNPELGPDDDKGRHLVMGDIMSPRQTEFAARELLNWAKEL